MGEAVYLLSLTLLLVLLGMTQNITWALLQPAMAAGESIDIIYWIAQLFAAAMCFGIGIFGFQPGFSIRIDEMGLGVEQAGRSWIIPHPHIERVVMIPTIVYHRHYRRYARTLAFMGAKESHVVLVETREAPLVLGLPAMACDSLIGQLEQRRKHTEAAPFVVA
jgi:hypothetical protein